MPVPGMASTRTFEAMNIPLGSAVEGERTSILTAARRLVPMSALKANWFRTESESAIVIGMKDDLIMSNEPAQRMLSDFAMGILRQAGSELPRMTNEPIVAWAMRALGSTVPVQGDDEIGEGIPLPVSCLASFMTVDYEHGPLQDAI